MFSNYLCCKFMEFYKKEQLIECSVENSVVPCFEASKYK